MGFTREDSEGFGSSKFLASCRCQSASWEPPLVTGLVCRTKCRFGEILPRLSIKGEAMREQTGRGSVMIEKSLKHRCVLGGVLLGFGILWGLASSSAGPLAGCKTGCDCLSCVHQPGGGTTQGWYYIDGSCCYTWVSRNADNTKQPQFQKNRQRKESLYVDWCTTTVDWGEATACDIPPGAPDPTTDTACRTACKPIGGT
jgi:hypothetical protein